MFYGFAHNCMYLDMRFETLNLNLCESKLWELTVIPLTRRCGLPLKGSRTKARQGNFGTGLMGTQLNVHLALQGSMHFRTARINTCFRELPAREKPGYPSVPQGPSTRSAGDKVVAAFAKVLRIIAKTDIRRSKTTHKYAEDLRNDESTTKASQNSFKVLARKIPQFSRCRECFGEKTREEERHWQQNEQLNTYYTIDTYIQHNTHNNTYTHIWQWLMHITQHT